MSDRGLRFGSYVEVDCEGRDEWSKAIITQVHADGSMTVKIVGKEGKAQVPASRVRPAGPYWAVEEGSVVEIELHGDSTLPLALKGVVVRLDRFNGTCDVVLPNGQRKEKVALCNLRKPDYDIEAIKRRIEQRLEIPHLQETLRKLNLILFEDQGTPGTERPGAAAISSTWAIGQRVEARFKNGERWYGGTVSRVHADGTVDVAFYGKGTEARVKPENVQPIAKDGAGRSGRMQVGALVEPRFAGRSQGDPAFVWARYDDGSVDLVCIETRVRPDQVQAMGTIVPRRWEGVSKPPQERSSSMSLALADTIDAYRAATPKEKRVFWVQQLVYGYVFYHGIPPSIVALREAVSAIWGG
jgi:hypothetical protein